MEIKVTIDDAKIIREVLNGQSKAEIEREIVADIKRRVAQDVLQKMRSDVDSIKNDVNTVIYKNLRTEVLKHVEGQMHPLKIKKLLNNDDWKSWMEDTVGECLSHFVETALSEWLTLEIVVKSKGKQKSVELCGKDSYTHRRK